MGMDLFDAFDSCHKTRPFLCLVA